METQFVGVVGGFVERRSHFVFTYRVERELWSYYCKPSPADPSRKPDAP